MLAQKRDSQNTRRRDDSLPLVSTPKQLARRLPPTWVASHGETRNRGRVDAELLGSQAKDTKPSSWVATLPPPLLAKTAIPRRALDAEDS